MKLIKISNTETLEQYNFLLELKKFYEYVNFTLFSQKKYPRLMESIMEVWKGLGFFLCFLLLLLGLSRYQWK